MSYHLLVVGSLSYDSVETPQGRADQVLGGSANYFTLAASLLSPGVRVVGVVGEDYRDSDRELLLRRGADLSGVVSRPGKTFYWEGSYLENLNEAVTRVTELNVFAGFDPNLPDHFCDSQMVFLANIDPILQLKVLDQVKSPVWVGMDTMNYWIQSKMDHLKEVLSRVNLLLVNEKEAMAITGASNAVAAASLISSYGPECVVIKRGEYGFLTYTSRESSLFSSPPTTRVSTSISIPTPSHSGGRFFAFPAFPVPHVVDPTGAGDSFAGGVFGYLASLGRRPRWEDLKSACLWGGTLSSLTVQDFSVRALEKDHHRGESLRRRWEEYKSLASLEKGD